MAFFDQTLETRRLLSTRSRGFLLFLAICLIALLLTTLTAQADDASLRSDISGLQSRVTRLESEIGYLRQSSRSGAVTSAAPRYQPPSSVQTSELNQDPYFKQLAKLLVELKEDVQELEGRVNRLEKRSKPSQ